MKKLTETPYTQVLLTQVRDKSTKGDKLREVVNQLGKLMGQEIIGTYCTERVEVETPMQQKYTGIASHLFTTVVLSTRDDADHFASGISSVFEGVIRGYMDFSGARGQDVYNSTVQAVQLPLPPKGQSVDMVIVAKSVLATGCTAVTLANKAIEVYRPERLIIATTFYSLRGIEEVHQQVYPRPEIYVMGEADSLNGDGMLIPGVGNLDKRLTS